MVSAAKLRRAQSIMKAGKPYSEKLQALLERLADSASAPDHPLFKKRDGNRAILVVFTADRGLCGAFNSNLIAKAEKWIKEQGRENVQLYCVGRKGFSYFTKRNWDLRGSLLDLSGKVDSERSNELAANLQKLYLDNQCDDIYLLYSSFISTATFRPTISKYLGLQTDSLPSNDEETQSQVDYILEPSADALFDSLLPRYLQSKIYITLAEQLTSEHSARMLAMHNATENCQEMTDALTLRLNNARQASITTDLLDIVGGAEAIKG